MANSRIREALAQADSIADTIAFQVTQAYRQLAAARKGIDRTRPAVEQSRETYRLVQARSREGDAIPAELTDAEAALTRAEQDYFNAVYDYLIARARLEYALGISPTPTTMRRRHQAAEKTSQKAVEEVSLAETGELRIREAELLTAV